MSVQGITDQPVTVAQNYPGLYTPETEYTPEKHTYRYRELGLEVVLDRFYEDQRDGLSAEITVLVVESEEPTLLHYSGLLFRADSSRKRIALACAERATEEWHGGTDFSAILEHVVYHSQKRWREGEQPTDLAVEPQGPSLPRWLEEPFLEYGQPNVIYAHGGGLKSTTAETLAVEVACGSPIIGKRVLPGSGKVLVLDWEADDRTWRTRMRAICAGAGLEMPSDAVLYTRQHASLVEIAPDVTRLIQRQGVALVIIDSMGAARGGEPEDAATTIKFFNAARSMGVTWLGLDHVSKESIRSGRDLGPVGSVYTWNETRNIWVIVKKALGGGDLAVQLVHRKGNNGREQPDQTFRVIFENQYIYDAAEEELRSIRFLPAEVRDMPELMEGSPRHLGDRILYALEGGPASAAELTLMLGSDKKTVQTRLAELLRRGKVSRGNGEQFGLPGQGTQLL